MFNVKSYVAPIVRFDNLCTIPSSELIFNAPELSVISLAAPLKRNQVFTIKRENPNIVYVFTKACGNAPATL